MRVARAFSYLIVGGFLAACASTPPRIEDPRAVRTGLDVLQAADFLPLRRPEMSRRTRVGVITNHTAIDGQGASIVDVLMRAKPIELAAIFSPEHGFEGKLEGKIKDARHASGLAIHSLYGESRKPSAASLAGLDCLVFDIQDIGCRFYTYISTMGLAMQAAREQGLRFVVLDRPNPIGGVRVEGPMLDGVDESFVGWHAMPVRHGMTVAEIARMFARERPELRGVELVVVPCEGWSRAMLFDDCGLRFVPPSPNMRNLYEATLYPGVGLVETTNVSVGRGTDTPFERIGAPWIDGVRLARRLNAAALPGCSAYPIRFTPRASKFKGEECGGVAFVLRDRERFDPVVLGFELATALRDLFGDAWKSERYLRLLGNRPIFDALRGGATARELVSMSRRGLEEFRARRARALLYD